MIRTSGPEAVPLEGRTGGRRPSDTVGDQCVEIEVFDPDALAGRGTGPTSFGKAVRGHECVRIEAQPPADLDEVVDHLRVDHFEREVDRPNTREVDARRLPFDAADAGDIGRLAGVGGTPEAAPFQSPVEDFYLTNPIARASAVMAECSVIAEGHAELTAAE